MERNLTTGNIGKTIAYFALPYLLSYFLQTLYGMADLFIIGQFDGVDGITAVSNGGQVMHMLTVIIVGLAMGTTVTIGKSVGAGKLDAASASIGNTVTFFMGMSVVVMAVLVFLVNPIVTLIGIPAEAVAGTRQYLFLCFLGIPFITAYNVISAIFRGLGDSQSPMYFIAIACVANIVLDYVFIGGLGMGPIGAALGTTLAQTISVIISLIAIRRKETGIHLTKKELRVKRDILGQILKIGIPVAVQDGCIQVAFIVISVIANHRGLNDAAAVGVVEKLIGMIFIVPSSMLATVPALSAQNIGAGRHDRARKLLYYAILITGSYGIVMTILIELFSKQTVGIFTTDAAVILLGSQYISSYIIDCIFAGIHFCFTGYFNGCGKTLFVMIQGVAAAFLVRIPFSYFMSRRAGVTMLRIGFASPLATLLSIILCIIYYFVTGRRSVEAAE